MEAYGGYTSSEERDDIEDILNFVVEKKSLGIITFPTNGVLTGRIVQVVKNLQKKLRGTKLIITCSIDDTRELHDKERGVSGTYDKCIETFIKLRGLDIAKVYLGVTVSRDNCLNISSLFSSLHEKISDLSFSELHFNIVNYSFFYNNANIAPLDSAREPLDYDSYILLNKCYKEKSGKRIKCFLEDRYFKLLEFYLKTRKAPIKCSALHGSCFIDPYGDVYPCINYENKIGNLELTGYHFVNFWKRDLNKKEAIRESIDKKMCPGCWTPCEAYPSILSNLLTRGQNRYG
ncbi:MAG: SPASM domain-containing protein [Candidatus Omnitrophica bacterium]|nr:SPASM domain-containing protein [Candidatus Omnitrophota bacterium]